MKKITLLIAGIIFLANTVKAQKAFEKGTIAVDLGIGIAVYGTKLHSQTTSGNKTYESDTTDGAVSVIYPLAIEYGVSNWLGIGARFAYSSYFEERDSITGEKASVRGIDADIVLNFHLIKTKRFDLPIGLIVGYSNFNFKFNDPSNTVGKDDGMNYGIMLTPRIYFGDHIGIFFNLGYLGYTYPNIQFSSNTDPNINDNNNWVFKLKGNGGNVGLGLVAKF
ncbi:MAG: hypothetical protein ACT4ON_11805 [Bacteroidota bacterium]